MVIRDSLMTQFKHAKIREFEAFVISLLKREFPERFAMTSDLVIQEDIRRLTLEAGSLAIVDENSVAKFIYLKWLVEDDYQNFRNPAWLAGLIANHSRTAIERMDIALEGVARQFDAEPE